MTATATSSEQMIQLLMLPGLLRHPLSLRTLLSGGRSCKTPAISAAKRESVLDVRNSATLSHPSSPGSIGQPVFQGQW
jgi:hypothetical protein